MHTMIAPPWTRRDIWHAPPLTLRDALVLQLEDHRPLVRRSAAIALGRLGLETDIHSTALASRVADGDAVVRKAVVSGLGRSGVAGASALKTRLLDVDDEVRRCAAAALGYNSASASNPAVLSLGLADSNEWVRASALDTVGKLGPLAGSCSGHVADLLMETGESMSGRRAAVALGRMGQQGARHAGPLARQLHAVGDIASCQAREALERVHGHRHASRMHGLTPAGALAGGAVTRTSSQPSARRQCELSLPDVTKRFA